MNQDPESPPPRHVPTPVINVSGSFASVDTKKLGRQGRRKATPQEHAVAVSKATAQATAAAKSILSSGGTHDTALSTARAAAESVLVPRNGDKMFVFSKRQAKQQASVVAAMALLSAQAATNKFPSKNQAEAMQFMQAPTPEATSQSSSRRKPPSVVQQDSKAGEFSSVGGGSFGNSVDWKPTKPLRKDRSKRSPQLPPSRKMPYRKPPMHQASKPCNQKNGIDDYFSRRCAPEVERSFDNLDTISPAEQDPIYVPPATSEPAHSLGDDDCRADHSDERYSLEEGSDDESLAETTSSDAFEDNTVYNTVEDNNDENREHPTQESMNIGKMLYEGIFSCPYNAGHNGREKDDMSRDYSRHSDESSQDDDGKLGIWLPLGQERVISRDYSTRIPKSLEVQTSFNNSTGKVKIKSAMKTKPKESIEKVVLRAMHSEDPPPSMYTSSADTSMSGTHRSVASKKSTMSRVKKWMKRKQPKRGIR
jgi:hypothetical protein